MPGLCAHAHVHVYLPQGVINYIHMISILNSTNTVEPVTFGTKIYNLYREVAAQLNNQPQNLLHALTLIQRFCIFIVQANCIVKFYQLH